MQFEITHKPLGIVEIKLPYETKRKIRRIRNKVTFVTVSAISGYALYKLYYTNSD